MSQPFRSRDYTPMAPADRPVRHRRAARVVVTDGDSVLLLSDSDPGVGVGFWITPGGGADPGETPRQTAVRELAEETGQQVEESELLGPIRQRIVVHGFSNAVLVQWEDFFLLRVPAPFAVDVSGHTPDEQVTLTGARWHPIGTLATLAEPVWPADLADLVGQGWPGSVREPMVGAPRVVEESIVPVPDAALLADRFA